MTDANSWREPLRSLDSTEAQRLTAAWQVSTKILQAFGNFILSSTVRHSVEASSTSSISFAQPVSAPYPAFSTACAKSEVRQPPGARDCLSTVVPAYSFHLPVTQGRCQSLQADFPVFATAASQTLCGATNELAEKIRAVRKTVTASVVRQRVE